MLQEQNKTLSFPLYNPSPDVKQRRVASEPKRSYSEKHRTSTAGQAPCSICKSILKRRASASRSLVLQQKSTSFTFLPRGQQRLGLCLAEKTHSDQGSNPAFCTTSLPAAGMQDTSPCAWISRWVKAQVPAVPVPP